MQILHIMSKITLPLLFVFFLIIISCQQDSEDFPEETKQTLKLNFNDSNSKSLDNDNRLIEAEIVSKNPLKIYSPLLKEIKAKHSETNIESYGYVLISDKGSSLKSTFKNTETITETGYFYDGDKCFIHGTMITDTDSGVSIFIPTSIFTPVGFEPVCAGFGEAWAIDK